MIVEISVGKSSYKINCAEKERKKILNFATRLNQRVNELTLQLGQGHDEKNILVITALMMEEEIEKLRSAVISEEKSIAEEASKQSAEDSLTEQDVYDAVSENMENVADYVEKLINKIRSY